MHITFVAYEGMTGLDLIGPLEVLSRIPRAKAVIVATRREPVTADNGALQVVATQTLDEVPHPDVIVVPGGLAGTRQAANDATLLTWLRQAASTAQWITSVCTGSLILGAAGLLQGRRATSPWVTLDELHQYGAAPSRSASSSMATRSPSLASRPGSTWP